MDTIRVKGSWAHQGIVATAFCEREASVMIPRRSRPVTALGTAIGLASLAVAPSAAWACGADAYIGSICVTGTTFCPVNTVEANGLTLAIRDYGSLYAVIGCRFGGDCQTSFAVPDLRGRSVVGKGTGVNLTSVTLGQNRGTDYVTQTVQTMTPHTHSIALTEDVTAEGTIAVVPGAVSSGDGTATPEAGVTYSLGGVGGKANYGPYTTLDVGDTPATVTGVSVTLTDLGAEAESTGGGTSLLNLPPQLVLRFCIVTKGNYPDRP